MKGCIFPPLVPPFRCYWGTIEEVTTTVSLNRISAKFSCTTRVLLFFWKCTPLKPHCQSKFMDVYMFLFKLSKFCLWGGDIKWKQWSHNTTVLKESIAVWLIEIHQLAPIVKRASLMKMTRIYLHGDSCNRLLSVKGLKNSLVIFIASKLEVSSFIPWFNHKLRSDEGTVKIIYFFVVVPAISNHYNSPEWMERETNSHL